MFGFDDDVRIRAFNDRIGRRLVIKLLARIVRHHPAPFAAGERLIVKIRQPVNFRLRGRRFLRREKFFIFQRGGFDRVFDEFKKSVVQFGCDIFFHGSYTHGQFFPRSQTLRHLAGIEQIFRPADVLRLALKIQPVVFSEDGSDFSRVFIAEIARDLFLQQVVSVRAVPRMRIPREPEKKFRVEFRRLQIADVQQPNFVRAKIKCLRHLLRDERGRRGAEPEIIARRAPIRDVIINSRTAAAPAFGLIGKLADVTVVVIRPDERDVLRQIRHQAVKRQHFLVGAKNLRHGGNVRVHVAREHFALRGDDGLQARGFLAFRAAAGHCAVVDAAHADGVNIFKFPIFADALLPIFQNTIRVRDEIVVAENLLIPLADVVAHHLLAMRRAHNDAVFIGDSCVVGK